MTLRIEVKILGKKELARKVAKLESFFNSSELKTVSEDAKNFILRQARAKVPRKSFTLYRSLEGEVQGFGTRHIKIKVGSPLAYAPHVEFGTRSIGLMRPRTKKAFFWSEYSQPRSVIQLPSGQEIGAVFHFASQVRHRGSKAQPYMRPALDEARPRLESALTRVIRDFLASSGSGGMGGEE